MIVTYDLGVNIRLPFTGDPAALTAPAGRARPPDAERASTLIGAGPTGRLPGAAQQRFDGFRRIAALVRDHLHA